MYHLELTPVIYIDMMGFQILIYCNIINVFPDYVLKGGGKSEWEAQRRGRMYFLFTG